MWVRGWVCEEWGYGGDDGVEGCNENVDSTRGSFARYTGERLVGIGGRRKGRYLLTNWVTDSFHRQNGGKNNHTPVHSLHLQEHLQGYRRKVYHITSTKMGCNPTHTGQHPLR